jgi:hypothetical protein
MIRAVSGSRCIGHRGHALAAAGPAHHAARLSGFHVQDHAAHGIERSASRFERIRETAGFSRGKASPPR